MDVVEVETDNPRRGAEDHRRLLSKQDIHDGFEFFGWDVLKVHERIVVRVRSTNVLGVRFE
jgi:transketolase N-terminal domain/subunit